MNAKERILATLARKPVDRLPVDLWYTAEVGAALRQHCGVINDLALWKELGLDKIAWVFMDYKADGGERAGGQSGAGAESGGNRTMWGVPLKGIQAGEAHYAEFGEAPLLGYETPESLDNYPWWPQVDRFDYDGAVEKARVASAEYAVIGPWVSFYEIYCQMRGLEQAMMDLLENPELVEAILDRIEAIQTEMMKRFFARGRPYLDLVFISDDLGTQNSLLISPDLWQQHLRPRMKRWCDLIHAQGLKVFFHTDGASEPLIGPLIDCGIDVLNPIQHICPGMEPSDLKKKYGDRVIFHGGVDNQRVLPFGTPADVRAEVQMLRATLGAGNEGFICCSCHNVQAGTPVPNILAMIDEMKKGSGSQ
jgi:uroporphyrinogen decarboxylase